MEVLRYTTEISHCDRILCCNLNSNALNMKRQFPL